MFKSKRLSTLPILLALLTGVPAIAMAQGADPGAGGAPGAGGPAATLDAQTKMQFAQAFSEIRQIQTEYSRKLQAVEDREKAQAIQQEAQQEMVSAVEDNGIDVATYNELVNLMSNDPEFQAEIETMIK